MVSQSTLLVCSMVLDRYLDVLAEHPNATTPQFRAMVAAASADIKLQRDLHFMAVRQALLAVPTETDQASLLSPIARG